MKQSMQQLVERWLLKFAVAYLRRTHPTIIAVTGSVGKTTTKELIAGVLKPSLNIRASLKSQNSLLGLPLSVLGIKAPPPRQPLKWAGVLYRAWRASFSLERPEAIVLELGVDHPGEMDQLLRAIKPTVGVILSVAPAHLDSADGQFASLAEIAAEKAKLAKIIPKSGLLLLNDDDPLVRAMAAGSRAKVVRFGGRGTATVRVTDISLDEFGTHFNLVIKKGSLGQTKTVKRPLTLPWLGGHFAQNALAAVIVGIELGLSLDQIERALKNLPAVPGRLRPLPGKNGMLILDDTYNANPVSMVAAIKTLAALPSKKSVRKVAVLGNMNELGAYAREAHGQVGVEMVRAELDYLMTVGERGLWIAEGALSGGFPPKNHRHFKTPEEAMREVPRHLKAGDTVLIKASQNGMRLERLTKELLENPAQAADLLVRQEVSWEKA